MFAKWFQKSPLTNYNAVTVLPPGPFGQVVCPREHCSPLPSSPLERRLPGGTEVAVGGVRLPLRDFGPGKAAKTASSHDYHPAAMAERQRVHSFYVLSHFHFKYFVDNLWPGSEPTAHFTECSSAHIIKITMDLVRWSFDSPQICPT